MIDECKARKFLFELRTSISKIRNTILRSCFTKPRASLAYTRNQPYVQDDARRVSREHWDVVTSSTYYILGLIEC